MRRTAATAAAAAAAAAPPQPEFSLRSRAQHTTSAAFSATVSPQHVWIGGGRIRSAVDPWSKDKFHRIDGREPLLSAAGFIYLHSTNRLQRNSDHCRELYFVCTWRVNLRPVMSWLVKNGENRPATKDHAATDQQKTSGMCELEQNEEQ